MKTYRKLLLILSTLVLVVLFQNCTDWTTLQNEQQSLSGDSQTPNPQVPSDPGGDGDLPGGGGSTPPTDPSEKSITPGMNWYWQLQGTVKTTVAAQVYDIDLYDSSEGLISSLKNSGKIVVCYFSAGSYEGWRTDAQDFVESDLGSTLDGWPDERWLDVRSTNVRRIMAARLDYAVSRGCDAVEPDNVDGYSNKNGVGLTKQNQIDYLKYLSAAAHERGLLIALKNATDLVSSLVNHFDFAVVEECFRYNECEMYSPFIEQNKAVLNAEYTNYSANTCSKAKDLQFSTVFFNLALDGKVFSPCP